MVNDLIFIKETNIAGRNKIRWQCPHCKENKAPESRFNLKKQESKVITCRFCKKEVRIP